MGADPERRRLTLGLALLALVVALVYRDHLGGWFLRDDFMWLRDAQRQWAEPARFWTTRPSGYFRPVANLVFGLEYAVFGLSAVGYLWVNLLLHLANVTLLALLVRALGAPVRTALAAAAFAGLAVTAVPGVVWISDIVSLLALLFVLGAALFHRRFVLDGHLRDGVLAFLCVALAAGSRESGVLAGAGIVLVELHHAGPGVLARRAFWARLAPFVLLGAAYLAVQTDLSRFDAVQRQEGAPVLRPFLDSWVANLPAVVAWREGGESVSRAGGWALLVGFVLAMGALGRRRGLVLAAWLLGLGLLAMAPYLLQLAKGPTLAGRYRYEAVFVGAAAIAALFHLAWGHPGALAAAGRGAFARRVVALGLLVVLLGMHARAAVTWLDEELRFVAYADQTRSFAERLDELVADWGRTPVVAGRPDPLLVLAGGPVENERHLLDQLVVFHGWPEDAAEAVDSVVLDLSDLTIPGRLQVDPAGLLTSAAEAHLELAAGEVAIAPFVWSRQSRQLTGAGRAKRVFGKLRFDWRRPQEPAVKAHLRLLRLTPEVRAALVAHHGPPADEPVDDPVDDPTTPADPEEAP